MGNEAPPPSAATVQLPPRDAYDHHRPLDEWDPDSTHAELRSSCPVAHTPAHGGYWVVTSHDLVRRCGRDPEAFSSEHDLDGSRLGQEFGGIAIPPQGRYRGIPSEIDGTAFHAYRRLLLPWFTPVATARWLPVIRSITIERVDRHLESGQIDLVLDLANPVPAMVTMMLVGLEADQWEQLCGSIAFPRLRSSSLAELARRAGGHRPSAGGVARPGPLAPSEGRRRCGFGGRGG